MKQALMALAIAVGPLLSGFADEAPQPPPAPVIVAQFLGFSDTQAAQFQQLLQSLQATVGGLQRRSVPSNKPSTLYLAPHSQIRQQPANCYWRSMPSNSSQGRLSSPITKISWRC
jgi:hypothetical protein